MPNTLVVENISFKVNHNQLTVIAEANQVISLDLTLNSIDSLMLKGLFLQLFMKIEKKRLENKRKLTFKLSIAEAAAFYKIHRPHLQNYRDQNILLFSTINTICSQIESQLL